MTCSFHFTLIESVFALCCVMLCRTSIECKNNDIKAMLMLFSFLKFIQTESKIGLNSKVDTIIWIFTWIIISIFGLLRNADTRLQYFVCLFSWSFSLKHFFNGSWYAYNEQIKTHVHFNHTHIHNSEKLLLYFAFPYFSKQQIMLAIDRNNWGEKKKESEREGERERKGQINSQPRYIFPMLFFAGRLFLIIFCIQVEESCIFVILVGFDIDEKVVIQYCLSFTQDWIFLSACSSATVVCLKFLVW